MNLTGQQLIGFSITSSSTLAFQAHSPTTGETLPTLFYQATASEVEHAVSLAQKAFLTFQSIDGKKRANFLHAIAQGILDLGDALLDRYVAETGLPRGRAGGERGRTINQIRAFAQSIEKDDWRRIQLDPAQPDRTPLPKPSLVSWENALGPVVVFGASNFPLAFSVAGGDTIAALAAGCPVLFKAHPAHPGTSEMVGRVIQQAAQEHALPEGVFSMLVDPSFATGSQLVQHPAICAVAFTGSFRGGKALFDLAANRPKPIPVYAEMGSINPVFLFPTPSNQENELFAQGYVDSLILGTGQFCTNPGVLFVSKDSPVIRLIQEKITVSHGGAMLTVDIQKRYERSIKDWKKHVALLGTGQRVDPERMVLPHVFLTDWTSYSQKKNLHEEVFGPSGLIVTVQDTSEFLEIAEHMEGQLTVSLHGTADQLASSLELIQLLKEKAGRLVFNGFPTGVEVSPAMVHGGPFPATTDSRSTSVGLNSIYRFTRPVCFQNAPMLCLPTFIQLKLQNT